MDIQKNPLKLYIQDIFRANRTVENKYVYEIFGVKFKNLMIHGIVTAVYNKNLKTTNLEISDVTGSVQVYYDSTKNKNNLSETNIKDLLKGLTETSQYDSDNAMIMSSMLDVMIKKRENLLNYVEGDYVCLVGDIFVDELKNVRMMSAYQCQQSSLERDLVWMEELRYLYEKFYLWNKIPDGEKDVQIL